MENRIEYLIQIYLEKYKLDNPVNWTGTEIDELGPPLRSVIKRGLHERQEAERRVAYMQVIKKELERRIVDGVVQEEEPVEDEDMMIVDQFSGELTD